MLTGVSGRCRYILASSSCLCWEVPELGLAQLVPGRKYRRELLLGMDPV